MMRAGSWCFAHHQSYVDLMGTRSRLLILGVLMMGLAHPPDAQAERPELDNDWVTIHGAPGNYRLPARYNDPWPLPSAGKNQTWQADSWGFLFWNSDGKPPMQDPISIAGLQPREPGRSPDDFLIKITAVGSLGNPLSQSVPISTQLVNILNNFKTPRTEFSNEAGCLKITFRTDEAVAVYWFGSTGKFPKNFSYLFRGPFEGPNHIIDGQIDYPERKIDVHVIVPTASLPDLPKIAERIAGFLNQWTISP